MDKIITLYHGTDEASSVSILKDGFKAGGCLTNSEDVAYYYATVRCEEVGVSESSVALLEVTVSQSDLSVDFAAYAEPLTFYRNQWANTDSDWDDGCDSGEIPYPTSSTDVKTALEVTGCVMSTKHIMAESCELRNKI